MNPRSSNPRIPLPGWPRPWKKLRAQPPGSRKQISQQTTRTEDCWAESRSSTSRFRKFQFIFSGTRPREKITFSSDSCFASETPPASILSVPTASCSFPPPVCFKSSNRPSTLICPLRPCRSTYRCSANFVQRIFFRKLYMPIPQTLGAKYSPSTDSQTCHSPPFP